MRVFQLLLITVTVAAAFFVRTTVGPLQEAVRTALGLSDNQMALLQGPALALPLLITALPLGLLIDRCSRVRLMLGFAVLGIAGNALTATASGFGVLLAARCLIGLTAAATVISAVSLLADWYSPAERGRSTMIMTIGQVGGSAAAFALGGELMAADTASSQSWRCAMGWLTAPLVVVTILMLALREPVRSIHIARKPSTRAAFAELWAYRATMLPLLGGVVVVDIALGSAPIWAAPAFARRFALPPDRIGEIIATVLLLGGVLGPIVGGLLADYCQRSGGPRRTAWVLSGLAFLSMLSDLFAISPSVSWAAALLALFNTLTIAISVVVVALMTIVIPSELRGLCTAVLSAAQVLVGLTLAPVAVSLLAGSLGGPAMIGRALTFVCLAASLLCALTFAIGGRNFPDSVPGIVWTADARLKRPV